MTKILLVKEIRIWS